MGCSHSPKMSSRCSSFATKIRQYAPMKLIFDNLKFDFNFLLENAPLMLKLLAIVRKTPVRHTLQPLCDLSATDNFHRSQKSQQGPRSVPARLQRSRRLIGDLVATKSVAARFLCLHKNLAATDLVADRSRRSRRPVPDQSPTSRRPIAD